MKDNPPTKKKQQQQAVEQVLQADRPTVSQQSTMPGELVGQQAIEQQADRPAVSQVLQDEEKMFQQYMDTLDLLRARITANLRSHNLSTDDLREAEALINLAEGLARAHRYIRPKWSTYVVNADYILNGLAEINEMLKDKKWPVDESGHPSDRLPPRLDAILWL